MIVHGGPGGGCQDGYRCFHDPAVYRIILFDQVTAAGCLHTVHRTCLLLC